MSTLNLITYDDLVKLNNWVHDSIEGCDGEWLELSNTIQRLITGYKDLRNFKLQEQGASAPIDKTVEVVKELVYVSECPFGMGYDYWKDLGVAALMWNTAISSPDDVVACVAHHLQRHSGDGVLQDFFWSAACKYSRDNEKKNFFVHVVGDDYAEIEACLYEIAKRYSSALDKSQPSSSYNCKHYWQVAT